MAYERVAGPLGEVRGDIQTAMLAALIHNQWAKHPKKPDAFMPEWDQPQTTTKDRLKAWVNQFGGSDGDDR